MNHEIVSNLRKLTVLFAAALLLLCSSSGQAAISGVNGPSFNLAARVDQITTADGGSVLLWGYAINAKRAQYPGPTLFVTAGQTVTVNLKNELSTAVSIVFPGQENVSAVEKTAPTQTGLLTLEALPGGEVTYSFLANKPGTYVYMSGTNPDLQMEMGLVGTMIVRPAGCANCAYDANTTFDREYLFFLSTMDARIHQTVEFEGVAALAATELFNNYHPVYFLMNGRTAMDTLSADGVNWLPTQPYGSLVLMKPGEKVLVRVVGGSREIHPHHTHGNHARLIALNGRLLQTPPGSPGHAPLDLSHEIFTINGVPGQTADAIFEWTGKDLGWDIYGTAADGRAHTCDNPTGYDSVTREYCPDHEKPFPVTLPPTQFMTIGPFYSGSPFMGAMGALPPGEGGLNPWGGFPFMWHSHNERELTNFNIFPGGMLTMLIIVPVSTTGI